MATGRILPGINIGNDSFPNTPMFPPSGSTGGGAVGMGAGNGNGQSPLFMMQRTVETLKYGSIQTSPFDWIQNQHSVILVEPEVTRTFLAIRNSRSSLGSLGIAFGNDPASEQQCYDLLAPGEVLLFDDFIPQNRVFAKMFDGVGKFMVSFSNAG